MLAPAALALGDLTRQQTWACRVAGDRVLMRPLGIGAGAATIELAFPRER